MSKPMILIGGGGHAAVLAELANDLEYALLGFTDVDTPANNVYLTELDFLGNDDAVIAGYDPEEIRLINGLGSTEKIKQRATVFNRFTTKNFIFNDVIHPSATLSVSATLGQGVLILTEAIVNTGAHLGDNVLLNSRALIEHHCIVGSHSHIASGAIVCGECRIGESVHIGAGAIVNQGICIGDGAIIASGAVVIADVPAESLMAGVPAIKKR